MKNIKVMQKNSQMHTTTLNSTISKSFLISIFVQVITKINNWWIKYKENKTKYKISDKISLVYIGI